MNILVLFTYGMSFKSWQNAGILDREIKLYNTISEKYEINYTFLTFGDSEDFEFSNKVKNSTIIPIYHKNKYYQNKLIRFLHTFYIAFKLRTDFKNMDIVKSNQLMGSWIGIILKFFNKTPLIVRTGYDIFSFSLKNRKLFIKIFFYYLLTQISLIFSDLYIVTSASDKKLLKKYFLFNEKKFIINPNWVDTKTDLIPHEKRYATKILSIGRLEYQKNYEFLINELKDSNFEIDIYGEGSLHNNLIELSKKNNVRLNLFGTLPNKDLLEVMEKYKFFCLMSRFEGNPKATLEAMSRGCVCIVSNISSNKEIIEDKINGFLVHYIDGELSNKINNIVNDENLIKKIGLEAQKNINKNFSFENALLIERKNYKSVLNI